MSASSMRSSHPSDKTPLLTIVRLTLPKLGVAYAFTLLLSVFNRVMINELAIAAGLIGALFLLYRLMNVFQVWAGRYADRRSWFGLRRTPMMVFGLLLATLALVPLPHAAIYYSETRSVLGLALMVASMSLFGLGFAMNGDAHNTLIAELTEGKRNRPAVVATVWLFQIVFIVISGIVSSIVLQIADTQAGAPPSCTTAECAAIRSATAVRLMPAFFLVGPVVALVGLFPLLGLEPKLSSAERAHSAQQPPLRIREAYARIFVNPQARLFFFFIVTSIFALFLQDNILEPFGADVFKLAPRQTAQFQPIMGMGTILAMLVMGIVASKFPIPKRQIADWGLLTSALGFALLALSALAHLLPVMFAGIAVLGIGMGVFNVGSLSMMMDMTVPGETGSLMGAWGMAQALANGFAQLVGGSLRDIGIQLTGNFEASYSFIFVVAIGMCLISISLVSHVSVERFRRLTREQLVATMEATA